MIPQTITLHPFQASNKQEIYNNWNLGIRNVLYVLPTGGGKSIVTSDIVLDGVYSGLKQAVVAHRNELVTQMAMHLAKRGIEHQIIASQSTITQAEKEQRKELGRSFVNMSAPTAVVGVDTLMSRKKELESWCKQVDRWIIDEAHHTVGNEVVDCNKWGKAVKMFSNAKGLGVTATPCRADGQGLGADQDGVFETMVIGPNMRWLIDNKFLSDYEVVCHTSDLKVDDKSVSKDGDWSNQTLRKAAKESQIVGDVVANYCKFAYGRRAIVFATDVATAGDIAKNFCDNHIRAVSLSGKTLPTVRQQAIEDFKSGKISVLVNVDLFDEGFDVPACDVVIMARPTASLGKYRQMVGRALRYVIGKVALIIDHVSNIVRHKLPDHITEWSLKRRDKRAKQQKDPEELDLTVCSNPACHKPYEAFRTVCPYCGIPKPLPEPGMRTLDVVEGDLTLLDREALQKLRQAAVIENPADIAERVAHVAGPIAGKAAMNRQMEKIEAHETLKNCMAIWAGIQRHVKGLNDREIQKKFYKTTGYSALDALDAKQTVGEMTKKKELIESWCR